MLTAACQCCARSIEAITYCIIKRRKKESIIQKQNLRVEE